MTFSEKAWLLLIGAAIGLASSIIGAVVHHFLSLWRERVKIHWEDERKREIRESARAEAEAQGKPLARSRDGSDEWKDAHPRSVVAQQRAAKLVRQLSTLDDEINPLP